MSQNSYYYQNSQYAHPDDETADDTGEDTADNTADDTADDGDDDEHEELRVHAAAPAGDVYDEHYRAVARAAKGFVAANRFHIADISWTPEYAKRKEVEGDTIEEGGETAREAKEEVVERSSTWESKGKEVEVQDPKGKEVEPKGKEPEGSTIQEGSKRKYVSSECEVARPAKNLKATRSELSPEYDKTRLLTRTGWLASTPSSMNSESSIAYPKSSSPLPVPFPYTGLRTPQKSSPWQEPQDREHHQPSQQDEVQHQYLPQQGEAQHHKLSHVEAHTEGFQQGEVHNGEHLQPSQYHEAGEYPQLSQHHDAGEYPQLSQQDEAHFAQHSHISQQEETPTDDEENFQLSQAFDSLCSSVYIPDSQPTRITGSRVRAVDNTVSAASSRLSSQQNISSQNLALVLLPDSVDPPSLGAASQSVVIKTEDVDTHAEFDAPAESSISATRPAPHASTPVPSRPPPAPPPNPQLGRFIPAPSSFVNAFGRPSGEVLILSAPAPLEHSFGSLGPTTPSPNSISTLTSPAPDSIPNPESNPHPDSNPPTDPTTDPTLLYPLPTLVDPPYTIFPPSPPTSSTPPQIPKEMYDFITTQLPHKYERIRRAQHRDITRWERGYWQIDLSRWGDPAHKAQFWKDIKEHVEAGRLGPVSVFLETEEGGQTTQRWGEDYGGARDRGEAARRGNLVRVYCYGGVVGIVWSVLYVLGYRSVLGAVWVDSEGEVVVRM